MIVIRIYGFDEDTKAYIFSEIKSGIQEEISEIKIYSINKDDIEVFFPKENWTEGLGERIIIYIDVVYPGVVNKGKGLPNYILKKKINNVVQKVLKASFPKSPMITFFSYHNSDSVSILNP